MLMTCGPWKPVYLETFTSRIDELYFTAHVPESLKTATISATAEVVGTAEGLVFTLTGPDGKKVKTTKVEVVHGKATAEFKVKDPELWYPHGYGAQSLYKLSAALDGELDEASKTLGLRRALVQQKPLTDAEGLSFYFEINNIPIWAGGSNWVPVDSFLTRPDVAKYRSWLELAKDGRQVMIRWAVRV
jgi:beta-mannosidase